MAWQQLTSIRGPMGEQGPMGPEGPQGVQGPAGQDGGSVEIAGQVNTYADLPAGLTEAHAGDGYLVDADGLLYVWNGTSFPADGAGVEFRGPQGPQGPQGEVGPTGAQGVQGEPGAPGQTGPAGADGIRGNTWFTGANAPVNVTGSMVGDLYLDTVNGDVYKLA